MKLALVIAFFPFLAFTQTTMTPDKAYERLVEGNNRFATDSSVHPDRTAERRQETAVQQKPFAAILGCSDSRVPLEIIFDQGIGDLFIVRIAGNVVDATVLDSIEYATLYLGASLVVVLGHESCGAVQAVLDGNTKDIEAIAQLIQPAAKKTEGQTQDRLKNTIQENVKMFVSNLRRAEVLAKQIKEKKINIIGGYYDFHDGRVQFFKQN